MLWTGEYGVGLVDFDQVAEVKIRGSLRYLPQVGIINPGEFAPLNSIEIVVWVALGGRATLFGAIVGALIINYAKSWFTVEFPEVWLFALGGLFVLSTMYFPQGVIGFVSEKWQQLRKASNAKGEGQDKDDQHKGKEAIA